MTNSVLRGRPRMRGLAAALAAACSGLLAAACAGGSLPGGHAAASPSATRAVLSAAAAAVPGPVDPGAGAAPKASGGHRPPTSALPRCRTGQLSPAFTGLNSAMGGQQGMTLILTNHSGRSCSLDGYDSYPT